MKFERKESGRKEESPNEGLTSSKDLTIMRLEDRDSLYHRLD